MALFTWLVILTAPVLVGVYLTCFISDTDPPQIGDHWWGKSPKSKDKEDTSLRPFVLKTSAETLKDLQERLTRVRLPESLDGTQFEYGFRSDYLKEVVEYWKTKYDWEKHQKIINSFPQFLTNIDGIDVHFLRVLPSKSADKPRRVIMLIHGWPDSFWDFYKIIPLLTEPGKTTKDENILFEVICPSIPGYGFSEAPHRPGFNVASAAQIFYKLMLRLGHEKFYVQGGDWGSLIASTMAKAYPSNVIGQHLNLPIVPLQPPLSTILKQLLGEYFPSLVYTPEEIANHIPIKQVYLDMLKESGYFHIQVTKPDTVAAGLNDSPAGLAAYILEKFSTWSNYANRNCSDGCITKYFTLDEVLTNVMIYWLSGNIGSSMRFYKEFMISPECHKWLEVTTSVPAGITVFPHEIMPITRSIVSKYYLNIVHYTHVSRGGHFAAFEEPHLMADGIKSFVRILENQVQSSTR